MISKTEDAIYLSKYELGIIKKLKLVFPDFEYTYTKEKERFPRFEGTIKSMDINIVQFCPRSFLNTLDSELFDRLLKSEIGVFYNEINMYDKLRHSFKINNNGALY